MNFNEFDAVIISDKVNLFYLSKYDNADAVIIIIKEKKFYITDSRYIEEAAESISGYEIINRKDNSLLAQSKLILDSYSVKNLGVLVDRISFLEYENLLKNYQTIPIDKQFDSLRAVKTKEEIEFIKKAQNVTNLVYFGILSYIKPGITEIETASKINSLIYDNCCSPAFTPIVAFNKNTSKPHAHPTERRLEKNDIIQLDFGAKYKGYCSDMSRWLAVGSISDLYKERYNRVLEAQEYAISKLKANITGKEGDGLGRNYLKNYNLDTYFTHSLGHSLGIEIHENPRLSPRSDEIIPVNAITSVEPGIYFSGEMGIRIEDIVLFKENDVINLTNCPKELIIL